MAKDERRLYLSADQFDRYLGLNRNAHVCFNCRFFYQHYVKIGSAIVPIQYGHCEYPRLKIRKATDSCYYFQPRTSEKGDSQ